MGDERIFGGGGVVNSRCYGLCDVRMNKKRTRFPVSVREPKVRGSWRAPGNSQG